MAPADFNELDILGQKFNRLTVLSFSHRAKASRGTRLFYLCKCECGTEKVIRRGSIVSGETVSCGCVRKSPRLPNKESVFNELFYKYQKAASNRNYAFDLSIDEFRMIIAQNCWYCGITPSLPFTKSSQTIFYNGIDRMRNDLGYTFKNSVPCCKICNRAKSNMPYEEFVSWIKEIKNSDTLHFWQSFLA